MTQLMSRQKRALAGFADRLAAHCPRLLVEYGPCPFESWIASRQPREIEVELADGRINQGQRFERVGTLRDQIIMKPRRRLPNLFERIHLNADYKPRRYRCCSSLNPELRTASSKVCFAPASGF